ncbi:hypothetical protein K438DRAFT_1784064 [Mycena galopus ATCC 62051]|nr:hypothetical protein K438DRAFT_1784064 [Mycena galopus ATCC 62051]
MPPTRGLGKGSKRDAALAIPPLILDPTCCAILSKTIKSRLAPLSNTQAEVPDFSLPVSEAYRWIQILPSNIIPRHRPSPATRWHNVNELIDKYSRNRAAILLAVAFWKRPTVLESLRRATGSHPVAHQACAGRWLHTHFRMWWLSGGSAMTSNTHLKPILSDILQPLAAHACRATGWLPVARRKLSIDASKPQDIPVGAALVSTPRACARCPYQSSSPPPSTADGGVHVVVQFGRAGYGGGTPKDA